MLVKKGVQIGSRNLIVFSAEIFVFRWLQGIPFEQRFDWAAIIATIPLVARGQRSAGRSERCPKMGL
jgi:hypothetical protein